MNSLSDAIRSLKIFILGLLIFFVVYSIIQLLAAIIVFGFFHSDDVGYGIVIPLFISLVIAGFTQLNLAY